MVLLAVPLPGQMGGVMAAIAPTLPHAVVSGTGSAKQDVVALARQYLPQHLQRFVPAHPIAGAEKRRRSALVDLYRNKTW